MAKAEERATLLQLQDELKALDKLLLDYFPAGGHAKHEEAQQRVTGMLRDLKAKLEG